MSFQGEGAVGLLNLVETPRKENMLHVTRFLTSLKTMHFVEDWSGMQSNARYGVYVTTLPPYFSTTCLQLDVYVTINTLRTY